MSKLTQNPQYVARESYNGFDMSQLYKFSSTVGELLPIYYDLLQPGDKVTMKTIMKTRTQPLESAAMMHLTERVEWFFVPLEQIYKAFGSWYYGIQDLNSSFFYNLTPESDAPTSVNELFPHLNFRRLNNFFDIGRVGAGGFNAPASYFFNAQTKPYEFWRLVDCFLPFSSLNSTIDNSAQINNVRSFQEEGQEEEEYKVGFTTSINPMFFAAYQKVYFDYYRLSDRETNDAEAYNFDKWFNTGDMSAIAAKLFRLRYRPWKRDFFTNIQVSPLFGENSLAALQTNTLPIVNQWLTSMREVKTQNQNDANNSSEPTQVVLPDGATISPANIRASFAVEKLLEITRRAGKHYDAQTLAHFGVKVPTGIAGEVMFIGREESTINIADVIATAGTEETALGQVGGKGYGFGNGNNCKFTAPCHGILLGIYSAEPEVDYTDYGLNKLHTLINRPDWFIPQYDNLGMQPLFKYQSKYSQNADPNVSQVENATIFGWQWRYSELKTKYNVTRGNLADYGTMRTWAPSRIGLTSSSYEQFLINPTYLNSVMLVDYDIPTFNDMTNVNYWRNKWVDYASANVPNFNKQDSGYEDKYADAWNQFRVGMTLGTLYSTLYARDPLLHEFYFDVKKSSKMSTYGLPSL